MYEVNCQGLCGLKFYSKDGAVVLQTERNVWDVDRVYHYKTLTVQLDDGERIIGYKSRSNPKWPDKAYHCDFQFIIGRII